MNNKVELLGTYGDDETIALSAWTSTSRDLDDEKRKRIPDLIKRLWIQGHETPFEKGVVHFLVTTDIATHVHLLKHRISSLNAESARYKELREDKFYVPSDWPEHLQDWLIAHTNRSNQLYHDAIKELEPLLGRSRAKESARFFKSYNSQITADMMFNMRSFANFLKLRMALSAQQEVRELAAEMLKLVRETGKFEHTLEAWGFRSAPTMRDRGWGENNA